MDRDQAKRYAISVWKEWRITVFLIVFVLIPAKSSLADWNWVPTGSMNPTILEGDFLFVNKVAYSLRLPLTLCHLAEWSDPQRADIVICFSPEDGTRLVKRVVGVPGDMIEMRRKKLILNGQALDYTVTGLEYIEDGSVGRARILATEDLSGVAHTVAWMPMFGAPQSFGPIEVPQGHYFVMGDNRDASKDSRSFGFVQRKAIVGKAGAVVCSFDITDKYQPRFNRFFTSLN